MGFRDASLTEVKWMTEEDLLAEFRRSSDYERLAVIREELARRGIHVDEPR